jgi:hypothetical protein
MRLDQDERTRLDRDERTLEQIRKAWLDIEIRQHFPDGPPRYWISSEYGRALDAISRAALNHAEASRAPLSGGDSSFEALLEQGIEAVNYLSWGVEQPRWGVHVKDDEKILKLWSHRDNALFDLESKKPLSFGREEIEDCRRQVFGAALSCGTYRSNVRRRTCSDGVLSIPHQDGSHGHRHVTIFAEAS